jgi:hypothetical protein
MTRWANQTALRTALLAGYLILPAAANGRAAEITIRGVVRNGEGEVLKNPTVVLYDAFGKPFRAKPVFQGDGAYTITVKTDSRNLSLRYDHPRYHMHFINALSTQKGDDHTINPVLLDVSGPRSFDLILAQILSYRSIFLTEFSAKPTRETFNSLRARYASRIAQMPDPKKKYRPGEPQGETLEKLTPYQRKLIAFELRSLEAYYDAPWFDTRK